MDEQRALDRARALLKRVFWGTIPAEVEFDSDGTDMEQVSWDTPLGRITVVMAPDKW
jgi:hypothetical protein